MGSKEAWGHTFVYVRKVGAESGNGFEDCLSKLDVISPKPQYLISASHWDYLNGPSKAFIVSASRSSTACL